MAFLAKFKFDFTAAFEQGLPCFQLGRLDAETLAKILDPSTADYLTALCEWLDRDQTLDEKLYAAENRKVYSKKVQREVADFKQAVEQLAGMKTAGLDESESTMAETDSTASSGKTKQAAGQGSLKQALQYNETWNCLNDQHADWLEAIKPFVSVAMKRKDGKSTVDVKRKQPGKPQPDAKE